MLRNLLDISCTVSHGVVVVGLNGKAYDCLPERGLHLRNLKVGAECLHSHPPSVVEFVAGQHLLFGFEERSNITVFIMYATLAMVHDGRVQAFAEEYCTLEIIKRLQVNAIHCSFHPLDISLVHVYEMVLHAAQPGVSIARCLDSRPWVVACVERSDVSIPHIKSDSFRMNHAIQHHQGSTQALACVALHFLY